MIGSMVDKHLFEELLAFYLPEISNHLLKLRIPLSLLTLPWLLCLFIGTLPVKVTGLVNWIFGIEIRIMTQLFFIFFFISL
jgi:hypothetical protein